MGLLELRQVTKGFFIDRGKSRAAVALDNVSLVIEEGEFVSLVGPSGCGKTVTLSMMAGFVQPTCGEVLFRGAPVVGPGPERGVVFQEYSLFPWMSVLQNVVFAVKSSSRALGRDFDKADAEKRALAALTQVGLASSVNARPNTLSGGMKQRVAIARLLAMDSEVFLMDEPFSALDEQTRGALDESLFDLWKQGGKTVVFVTHNISEAVQMSSRIVLFSQSPGRILREWSLPVDFDRNARSRAARDLSDEIRSYLPLASCRFGQD